MSLSKMIVPFLAVSAMVPSLLLSLQKFRKDLAQFVQDTDRL